MSRNSKIGVAAIVVIAIIAVGAGAYELSYVPPASGSGSPIVSIVSPTDGATVSDTFTVTVSTSNFNIPTQGHIHVYLDTLQNYQLGNGPTFTFTNVAPGTHVIWAQLQNPDHSPLNPPVQTQPITITVESSGSLSPTVSIASPANGATVTGSIVTVTATSTNFNVPTQGHYHIYLDNTLQMAFNPTSTATFTNVAPGTHTITVYLANPNHSLVSPSVSQTITVTVTPSGGSSSPTVSILSPNNGDMVVGSAVTVAVTSTNMPAGGYYYVSMSNGGFITGNGPTFTFPSVTSGTHTITVDIRNPDGSMLNPDVSQTITISVAGGAGGGYSSSSGGGSYGY